MLVQGPYLVRGVSKKDGILALTGDSADTTTIEVFASADAKIVSWNGKQLQTKETAYGSLKATVESSNLNVLVPSLETWKVHDGLPEKLAAYNDTSAAWVTADHMTTMNPTKPSTYPVLYVDEYGFHNSFHIFRGYFQGPAKSVKLSVQGGTAFGWSAWLNGAFIGSFLGSTSAGVGNLTLSLGNVTVHENAENVLVVAQDNTGHDMRSAAVKPRGILGATLEGASFSTWKIAGEAGGDQTMLDSVRGSLAEGGLASERLGWHLAGFDDSSWNSTSPTTGFVGAGIYFYRTTIALDVPEGIDASFAFVLRAIGSKAIRVQLFVNGYQYARFNPYVGKETKFPVPPGILNYAGDNVIGLSVWAQSEEGAKVDVRLVKEYAVESSWHSRFDSEYLRPGWTEERQRYV